MPVIILNAWKASGGGSLVIHTLGSAQSDVSYGIAVDSSGNYYVSGTTVRTGIIGTQDVYIAKYSASHVLQWQRELGVAGTLSYGLGIAVDSTGNPYLTGLIRSGSINDVFIVKYNTSGTLQWQKKYDSVNDGRSYNIRMDSSDNIYLTGFSRNAANSHYNASTIKTDSAGSLIWSRLLGGTELTRSSGTATDSSGNVYISGWHTSNFTTIAAKYNSSGVLQWQRTLGVNYTVFNSVEVYDSNNIYFVGGTDNEGAGSVDMFIVKHNSSGVIQWQRVLGGTGSENIRDAVLDSVGNIYVAGSTTSEGDLSSNIIIAKYNSSGTLQWQRVLLSTTGVELCHDIKIDAAGDYLYLTGYTTSAGQGDADFLNVKLPTDGTGLATYGSIFTYAESTLTAAVSTLTDSASSYSDTAWSLTEQTSNFSTQASAMIDASYE